MENSSQSIVDLWGVITESKRIITSHSRHFLALSVLFLLPLSFSLSVFPTLLHTFTSPTPNHIQSLLRFSNNNNSFILLHPSLHHPHHKTLVFTFFFSCFFTFFFLLALSSITSSVHNGFYGRPVKLVTAFGSVMRSFVPLLVTFFIGVLVVVVSLGLLCGFVYLGGKFVTFDGFYDLGYWVGLGLLGFVLGYVFVNWVLVGVIVVVESKWGVEPLVRSKDLLMGMRWVALCLIGFFGLFEFVLLWVSLVSGCGEMGGLNSWLFAVQIVAISAAFTVVLLHGFAAMTVLYMYCKALHGELAGEIAHEFASDFVSLPFDEKKVPHVVCFVY